MAKGCGACDKPYHGLTVLECIQGSVPAPTVERVAQPKRPPPTGTTNTPKSVPLTPDVSTTNDGYVPLTSTSNNTEAIATTFPKNRKWEASHPEYKDWKRDYQREYMRRRRAGC